MKTKMFSLLVMLMFGAFTIFAAEKTEKVKVNGANEMCKERIQQAALAVDGVSNADWDKETQMLSVTFDDSKTSLDKVEMAIAKAGHDTANHKATNEDYNKLPKDCKYREGDKGVE
jgi:copper chaperone CopZ